MSLTNINFLSFSKRKIIKSVIEKKAVRGVLNVCKQ